MKILGPLKMDTNIKNLLIKLLKLKCRINYKYPYEGYYYNLKYYDYSQDFLNGIPQGQHDKDLRAWFGPSGNEVFDLKPLETSLFCLHNGFLNNNEFIEKLKTNYEDKINYIDILGIFCLFNNE